MERLKFKYGKNIYEHSSWILGKFSSAINKEWVFFSYFSHFYLSHFLSSLSEQMLLVSFQLLYSNIRNITSILSTDRRRNYF